MWVQSSWKKRTSKLLNPDWDGLSRQLGGALIPQSLKALYADHKLILERNFSIIAHADPIKDLKKTKLSRKAKVALQSVGHGFKRWSISGFRPARAASILFLGVPEFPSGLFVFADSESADRYFMVLSAESDADGPVYVAYYDSGGRFEVVAPSLKAFLSWDRRRIDHRTKLVTDIEHA